MEGRLNIEKLRKKTAVYPSKFTLPNNTLIAVFKIYICLVVEEILVHMYMLMRKSLLNIERNSINYSTLEEINN